MDSLIELVIVNLTRIQAAKARGGSLNALVEDECSAYIKLKEIMEIKFPHVSSSIQSFSLTLLLQKMGLLLQHVPAEGILKLLKEEVSDFVDRLLEFCEIFDIEVTEDSDFRAFKDLYLFLALHNDLIKQFKYTINIFFDSFFETGAPEFDPRFLGKGFFPRKLKTFFWGLDIRRKKKILYETSVEGQMSRPLALQPLTRTTYRSSYVIYTLFQGLKKGLLPLRFTDVGESLQKNKKLLSRDTSDVDANTYERVSAMLQEIQKEFGLEDVGKNLTVGGISSHATVECGFQSGGSVGYLATVALTGEDPEVEDDRIPEKENILYDGDQLFRDFEFLGYAHVKWEPVEIRGPAISDKDLARVEKALHNYLYSNQESTAVPACILEPMKVRIITKPRAGQFVPLKSIQKQLWSRLKSHWSKTFELIGATLSDEMVRLFINEKGNFGPERGLSFGKCNDKSGFWVSGDYSAATDSLKSWITSLMVKTFFSNLFFSDPEIYQRINKSLLGCSIEYDVVSPPAEDPWWKLYKKSVFRTNAELSEEDFQEYMKKHMDPKAAWSAYYGLDQSTKQQSGQLMGNVLSFPLLCISNLTAYWLSIERYLNQEIRLKDLFRCFPVRVNGDDILFKSDKEHYDVWNQTIREFGFEPSAGKNLISPEVLQINSQLYEVREYHGEYYGREFLRFDQPELRCQKIHYVNFGILTSRKKNDCSKDLSSGTWMNRLNWILDKIKKSDEEEGLPEIFSRLKNTPNLLSELYRGCPDESRKQVHSKMQKHLRFFQRQFSELPFVEVNNLFLKNPDLSLLQINWIQELFSEIFRFEKDPDLSNLKRFATNYSVTKLLDMRTSYSEVRERLRTKKKWIKSKFFDIKDRLEIINEFQALLLDCADRLPSEDEPSSSIYREPSKKETPLPFGRGNWRSL